MRSPPWNDTENGALVALYFVMLDNAQAGKPYNKAAMIRCAQENPEHPSQGSFAGNLSERSRGSIEAKLMNASAAHRDLVASSVDNPELHTMDGHGYRCLSNYQADLKTAMQSELDGREARFEDAEVRRAEQRAGA